MTLQVHIDHCNLDLRVWIVRISQKGGHTLRRSCRIQAKASLHQIRLERGFSMNLENMNGTEWVHDLVLFCTGNTGTGICDRLDGINGHLSKKVTLFANDLGGHAGFGSFQQILGIQGLHGYQNIRFQIGNGSFERRPVSSQDGGRMQSLFLYELQSFLQQLRRQEHDTGGPVPHFLVLQLCQIYQQPRRGMFDLELRQDGGPVVGNGDVSNLVHQHFVETDGS
mmetsp:Transcript_13074/g.22846  ORF Transcript_13074/g.22846 Transcript_13074/m.22846 type:complete len:224 (+) Transcript_13074:1051-1722(+)